VTLADRLVDPVLVVGTVAGEGGKWSGDPAQHGYGLGTVIDFLLSQLGRDDLSAFAIEGEMQLASGPAPRAAVLLNQPFSGATELQPGAVNQQMQWTGTAAARCWSADCLRAPAQRRIIRYGQIDRAREGQTSSASAPASGAAPA